MGNFKDSQVKQSSLIAQLVKNPPAMQETRFHSWVGKILWRRDRLPTPVFKKHIQNKEKSNFIPFLWKSISSVL